MGLATGNITSVKGVAGALQVILAVLIV